MRRRTALGAVVLLAGLLVLAFYWLALGSMAGTPRNGTAPLVVLLAEVVAVIGTLAVSISRGDRGWRIFVLATWTVWGSNAVSVVFVAIIVLHGGLM